MKEKNSEKSEKIHALPCYIGNQDRRESVRFGGARSSSNSSRLRTKLLPLYRSQKLVMAGGAMAPYGPQIPPALVIGNMANPGLGPLVSPQIVASLIVTIRQCRTQPIQSVYFGIRCYAGPLELGSQGGGDCMFKWVLCGNLKPTPSVTV